MDEISRRILDHFQVRKTKKQKEEFRKYLGLTSNLVTLL